jgi:hypothetical protein
VETHERLVARLSPAVAHLRRGDTSATFAIHHSLVSLVTRLASTSKHLLERFLPSFRSSRASRLQLTVRDFLWRSGGLYCRTGSGHPLRLVVVERYRLSASPHRFASLAFLIYAMTFILVSSSVSPLRIFDIALLGRSLGNFPKGWDCWQSGASCLLSDNLCLGLHGNWPQLLGFGSIVRVCLLHSLSLRTQTTKLHGLLYVV